MTFAALLLARNQCQLGLDLVGIKFASVSLLQSRSHILAVDAGPAPGYETKSMTVWVKWTLGGLLLAGVALAVVIVDGTWR